MTTATKILAIAEKYLGISQPSSAHQALVERYNAVKPLPVGYTLKTTDDWCDMFVTVVAHEAGAGALIGRECGVQRHIDIFKQKGIWIEDGTITPQPGDIITFNWDQVQQANDGFADHIGFVESVANGQITTIEGNTDRAVKRRTYQLGNGYIRGFARPNYAVQTATLPQPVILDISEHQKPADIDYDQLAAAIKGVIVRVQYGSARVDQHYQTHIKEFQQRGVPVAVYAWVRGTDNADMEVEATDFYQRAKAFNPVFWWLDVEEQSMSDMRGGCEKYRSKLKALGAKKVGVYVANHLYQTFNLDVAKFDGLWLPAYGADTGSYAGVNPTAATNYDLHQYTSAGKLPGYAGKVDLNRLLTDAAFFFGESRQPTTQKYFKLTTSVYLRQRPSEQAAAIALLKKGDRVLIKDIDFAEGYFWGKQSRKDGSAAYLILGKTLPYGEFV